MALNEPRFFISDSSASMTSDSTNASSANLLRPVNYSDNMCINPCNERESPLVNVGSNQRCCDRNVPVGMEICNHHCNGRLSPISDGCGHQCGRESPLNSDISNHRCKGNNSPRFVTRQYSTEQCKEVIIAYHKVKVYMKVLFVFNLILVFTVIGLILFCVFFLSNATNNDNRDSSGPNLPLNDKLKTDNSKNSENCELTCKDLAHRLGLLEEIKSLDKECCTIGDVVKYLKIYVDRNRSTSSGGTRPALQLVGGQPSNTASESPNFIQNWKWDKAMRVQQDITFQNDVITILVSGHYFIYSRIHLSTKVKDGITKTANQMPVTHALYRRRVRGTFSSIQTSSLKCSVQQNTTVHSSFLEGVAYLRVGDELKIGLTHGESVEFVSKNDNYVGLFKL